MFCLFPFLESNTTFFFFFSLRVWFSSPQFPEQRKCQPIIGERVRTIRAKVMCCKLIWRLCIIISRLLTSDKLPGIVYGQQTPDNLSSSSFCILTANRTQKVLVLFRRHPKSTFGWHSWYNLVLVWRCHWVEEHSMAETPSSWCHEGLKRQKKKKCVYLFPSLEVF